MIPSPMTRTAVFSPDGKYRYHLGRDWRAPLDTNDAMAVFVMLNPSTADERVDDPSVRRCIGFATYWGFQRLEVVNLFAMRATDPKQIVRDDFPVGPETDEWIRKTCGNPFVSVFVAWGAMGTKYPNRVKLVSELIGRAVRCLGVTKGGQPKHPLYVSRECCPQPWEVP